MVERNSAYVEVTTTGDGGTVIPVITQFGKFIGNVRVDVCALPFREDVDIGMKMCGVVRKVYTQKELT